MEPQETPASQDAEIGILCSAFIETKRTLELCVESGIRAEHFFYPGAATYFSLLMEFWEENEPIEDVTFQQTLRDRGIYKETGGRINGEQLTGAAFFIGVRTFIPTAYNADRYIEIVKDKAMRRLINQETSRLSGLALDSNVELDDIYGRFEATMVKVMKAREGKKTHTRDMRELVMRSMERLDRRLAGEWKIDMPTGIKALDAATLGFKAPMVTAIVGKPSDGKSSLAINIAEHLAIYHGKRVGIISLDDSDDQVADRIIQQMSRVSRWEIEKSGTIGDWDRDAMIKATSMIAGANDRLFIRDDGGLTPAEISATFATWKAKHGLDFGIIDHIQLARGDGNTRGKTEEAEQVSRTLKPMAKRFGIPLLVLSQVTKQSDGSYATKNSRALEEDANAVWTISREKDSTDAWIHISKNKDGPRDIAVPVSYLDYCTKFTDRESTTAEQPELVTGMIPAKKGRK